MFHLLFILSILLSLGSASSRGFNHLHQVYQFPNGTWVENIAVRQNGNLLVTLGNTPELWEVMLSAHPKNSSASLVHHFDDAQQATGMAELSPDVFAISTPDTVWKVDLNGDREKSPERIATLPAGTLNGMALLNAERGFVAISDSQAGLVWRLDTTTGEYTVILKDEAMAANRQLGLLLGINGLRVKDGYVYYANTPKRLLCRIPVDLDGQPLGPAQIISRGALVDDFAVDHETAYLAGLRDNVVYKVFLNNGTHEIAAGNQNSTVLMSATSAAFGRLPGPKTLFVTTGGEVDHPVNNTRSLGGRVMALGLGPDS